MIIEVRRGGRLARVASRRADRLVEAAAATADRRDDAPRETVRALVALEPAAERGPIVRLAPSVPFLAQLTVVHVDETGTPDRRMARRPDLVAPRAAASYRGTDRLATNIEPGFLVKREF